MAGSAISEGPMNTMYDKIFHKFDVDDSGYLIFPEFVALCKYMGLHLDEDEYLDLFAQIDDDGNNHINSFEFRAAMDMILSKVVYQTLRLLGMTIGDLIYISIVMLLLLLLLFVFIFLGIEALSDGSAFSAVINSILPLAAGGIAASRRPDVQEKLKKMAMYVQKLIAKLKDGTE